MAGLILVLAAILGVASRDLCVHRFFKSRKQQIIWSPIVVFNSTSNVNIGLFMVSRDLIDLSWYSRDADERGNDDEDKTEEEEEKKTETVMVNNNCDCVKDNYLVLPVHH